MGKYKSWTEREFRAYLFLYAADSNFEYNVYFFNYFYV